MNTYSIKCFQTATEAILALLSTPTIQTYYPKVNTMKYPVRVCIGKADAVLALMTLEEANQQFVVHDNCLVKQEVMPMSKEHVLGRLAYELKCVEDAKDFLAVLSENSGSSTYYRNKYTAQLNEHEANITILNQALSIMENSNV